MDETPDPRQQANAKLEARRQRIHNLRVRIAAVAVALFIAAWVGLYVQLVTGNDPALAGPVTPTTQSADPEATTDDSADDGWSDASSAGGWSDGTASSTDAWADDGTSSAQSASSAQPATVTSRQS